jgi:hypothetical protein
MSDAALARIRWTDSSAEVQAVSVGGLTTDASWVPARLRGVRYVRANPDRN